VKHSGGGPPPTLPQPIPNFRGGAKISQSEEWPTTRELHCLANGKLMTVRLFITVFVLIWIGGKLGFADVCVYKPPKVRHVAGVVVDPFGHPIPGVNITIIRDGASIDNTKTNDAGEFSFNSLKEGTFELSAAATGFRSARYSVLLHRPASQWNKSLRIRLEVGAWECNGDIRIVKRK